MTNGTLLYFIFQIALLQYLQLESFPMVHAAQDHYTQEKKIITLYNCKVILSNLFVKRTTSGNIMLLYKLLWSCFFQIHVKQNGYPYSSHCKARIPSESSVNMWNALIACKNCLGQGKMHNKWNSIKWTLPLKYSVIHKKCWMINKSDLSASHTNVNMFHWDSVPELQSRCVTFH